MQNARFFPGSGKFDKINSSFRSKIVLNPFTNKVPHLDGFSKGILQEREPDDKIYLLQSWIVRLVNKGYLNENKAVRIEFFEKKLLSSDDLLIFTLRPSYFEIHEEKYLLNERLNKFLATLYKQLKEGKLVTKDLIGKRIVINEDEIFAMKAGRFKNEDELREYCIKQIKNNIPEGAAKHFFYEYRSRFLNSPAKPR